MAIDIWLALDVGSVRIGVATARSDVRIAQPYATISNDPEVYSHIQSLIKDTGATALIVGWPRGLEGQSTDQTAYVENFVAGLRQQVQLPLHMQDEALTSRKAEEELNSRNKPFAKEEVDALAATFILEDYLSTLAEASHV